MLEVCRPLRNAPHGMNTSFTKDKHIYSLFTLIASGLSGDGDWTRRSIIDSPPYLSRQAIPLWRVPSSMRAKVWFHRRDTVTQWPLELRTWSPVFKCDAMLVDRRAWSLVKASLVEHSHDFPYAIGPWVSHPGEFTFRRDTHPRTRREAVGAGSDRGRVTGNLDRTQYFCKQ